MCVCVCVCMYVCLKNTMKYALAKYTMGCLSCTGPGIFYSFLFEKALNSEGFHPLKSLIISICRNNVIRPYVVCSLEYCLCNSRFSCFIYFGRSLLRKCVLNWLRKMPIYTSNTPIIRMKEILLWGY